MNRTGRRQRQRCIRHKSSTPLAVELDQGRYDELSIAVNDKVYVMPRRVRVFRGEAGAQNDVRNSSGITHEAKPA